jgi:hypothetical protein
MSRNAFHLPSSLACCVALSLSGCSSSQDALAADSAIAGCDSRKNVMDQTGALATKGMGNAAATCFDMPSEAPDFEWQQLEFVFVSPFCSGGCREGVTDCAESRIVVDPSGSVAVTRLLRAPTTTVKLTPAEANALNELLESQTVQAGFRSGFVCETERSIAGNDTCLAVKLTENGTRWERQVGVCIERFETGKPSNEVTALFEILAPYVTPLLSD